MGKASEALEKSFSTGYLPCDVKTAGMGTEELQTESIPCIGRLFLPVFPFLSWPGRVETIYLYSTCLSASCTDGQTKGHEERRPESESFTSG